MPALIYAEEGAAEDFGVQELRRMSFRHDAGPTPLQKLLKAQVKPMKAFLNSATHDNADRGKKRCQPSDSDDPCLHEIRHLNTSPRKSKLNAV